LPSTSKKTPELRQTLLKLGETGRQGHGGGLARLLG
jgi:hypothetical protein